MYKRTESKQIDLFKDLTHQLSSRKTKILKDKTGWHNVFFTEVYTRIPEDLFKPLYNESWGRPNASVKVMLSMMILKEGNGWTDEQLFDNCRFNIRVMAALGLQNIDEDIPTEATFYDFRSKMCSYQSETGQDLLKACFQELTSGQLETYNITGKKIRLDSKLINSNIKVCGRLELILQMVSKFIKPLTFSKTQKGMKRHFYEKLDLLKTKKTHKICFSLNKEEKEEWLKSMGYVISYLLKSYDKATNHALLQKLYEQQYQISESTKCTPPLDTDKAKKSTSPSTPTIEPKDKKQIKADSIQSAHDTDCSFRRKGKGSSAQQVNGYHANITETCSEENEFNLLTDYRVASANVSEPAFLEPSIVSTQQVIEKKRDKVDKVEEVITDGGYDSIENLTKMSQEDQPQLSIVKFKGKPSLFIFSIDEHTNEPIAQSKATGQYIEITKSKKGDKYKTKVENKVRYHTIEQIQNQIRKQKIAEKIPPESIGLRPNVESAIHQVFCKLGKRNKIKYRGQQKCNLYVGSRVIFSNFRRILKNLGQKAQNLIESWLREIMTAQAGKFKMIIVTNHSASEYPFL